MKHLILIKLSEKYRDQPIPQPLLDAMGEVMGDWTKRGILKDTAGLKPTSEGFRVRTSRNRLTVTDGPFTETKEMVGGFIMIDVASRKEALEAARQFMELHRLHWPDLEAECEVRPVES